MRDRRESKRFADIITALIGGKSEDYLPPLPPDPDQPAATQPNDQQILAEALRDFAARNG